MKTILAMLFATATLYGAAQDTSITRMEYFIDTDPGAGKATSMNIPSADDATFSFTADITSYSAGYHKLYIRTRDNLGRWSLTAKRNIEVIASDANNKVVNGEYFIDTDPGFGNAAAINVSTPDTAVLQSFASVTSGLSEGYHKLYGRFRDTRGNWSQTFRRNIEIIKSDTTKVINGEYFFRIDNGFGNCSPVAFTTPSEDGAFAFNIPAGQIPQDADTLFIRVRDDIENKWSITRIASVNGTLPLTLLSFTAVKQLNTARLQWQTTNEVNTAYFNIQRSTDAVNFNTIGTTNAKNTRTAINNYNYTDNIAGLTVQKIYYRLQQVDIDGKSQYSKIVYININDIKTRLIISPNPAKNYINIISHSPEDLTGAVISIVDMQGQTILKQQLFPANNQTINISSLAKGMYVVHIIKPAGTETLKLLVQ